VQTLNGLKSGKDRARNLSLVCALMMGASAPESGFPPRTEPPSDDRSIERRLGRVREPTLRPADAGVLLGT
jgi:hypothetical protein